MAAKLAPLRCSSAMNGCRIARVYRDHLSRAARRLDEPDVIIGKCAHRAHVERRSMD